MAKLQDFDFEVKFGVTPKGRSKWCRWDAPNAWGNFTTDLYPSEEDTEKFKSLLEDIRTAGAAVVENSGKKLTGLIDVYKEDSEGNVYFSFKSNASKVPEGKIPIFDKYGKVDPTFDKKIGNDSIIKIKYMAKPYYIQSTKQVGVTLRLLAIQVIELKEYLPDKIDFIDESESDEF